MLIPLDNTKDQSTIRFMNKIAVSVIIIAFLGVALVIAKESEKSIKQKEGKWAECVLVFNAMHESYKEMLSEKAETTPPDLPLTQDICIAFFTAERQIVLKGQECLDQGRQLLETSRPHNPKFVAQVNEVVETTINTYVETIKKQLVICADALDTTGSSNTNPMSPHPQPLPNAETF